jgi:hypothetical protein
MAEIKIDEEFSLLYPEITEESLLADEDFSIFAEGKLDSSSLSNVYKKYGELTERIRKREKEAAAAILANRLSSVGSLSNANPPEDTFFTREQVKAMSKSEIARNYEKIRKSQEKWK